MNPSEMNCINERIFNGLLISQVTQKIRLDQSRQPRQNPVMAIQQKLKMR